MRSAMPIGRIIVAWIIVCGAATGAASAEPAEQADRERVAGFAEKAFARMVFSAYFAGDTITPDRSAISYSRSVRVGGRSNTQRDAYTSEWLQWLSLPDGSGAALPGEASYSRFPAQEFRSTEARSLRDWKTSIQEFHESPFGGGPAPGGPSESETTSWTQLGVAVASSGLVPPMAS